MKILDLQDVLCCAFEGGSNYWYRDLHVKQLPDERKKSDFRHWYLEIPTTDNGVLGLENDDDEKLTLDLGNLNMALDILSQMDSPIYNRLVTGEYDANDADVFLQVATMGEVVYG